MAKRRVALLGGSFDPIHIGHIHLALVMKEKHQLDEVIFSPAFCSPHKVNKAPIASPTHRLSMVKLAVEGIENLSFTDFEISKEKISYTLELIKHFSIEGNALFFILTDDVAEQFTTWKGIEDILKLANPLTGIRSMYKKSFKRCALEPFLETFQKGFTPISTFEVSSSDIRNRLRKNLYCGHLLSAKVLDYISNHQLYSLLS